MTGELQRRTTAAFGWNLAQGIATRSVTVIITLVLARILVPADFGLSASIAVFIALATGLMDSGMQDALIRSQHVSQAALSTAFYTNLALGAFAYGLLAALAPAIATFYSEPRLVEILRVAGIIVVITSFQTVHAAVLSRTLNYRALLAASVPSSVFAGAIALICAHSGWGVWAIVAQQLTAAVGTTALLWLSSDWRPSRQFDVVSLKRLLFFGSKLFAANAIDTGFRQLYVVVIARSFSQAIAGCYFVAEKMRDLILAQVFVAVQTVTYPALASIEGDDVRLLAAYRKIVTVTTIVLFPALLFTAALSDQLVHLLLPSKWDIAASYLRLLCVAGLLYPLHAANINVLKIKGRADLILTLEFGKKGLMLLLVWIGMRFGVEGILFGQVLMSVIAYVPNSHYSSKLIGYTLRSQVADFGPALALATIVSIAIYCLGRWIPLAPAAELAVSGAAGAAAYLWSCNRLSIPGYTDALAIVRGMRSRIQRSPA